MLRSFAFTTVGNGRAEKGVAQGIAQQPLYKMALLVVKILECATSQSGARCTKVFAL